MIKLGCNDCDQVAVPVPGPPGPGGGGGTAGFTFTQTIPASVWTIEHNLGHRIVNVVVFSLDYGVQWDWVIVEPVSATTCRLTFDDPTSGIAYIL